MANEEFSRYFGSKKHNLEVLGLSVDLLKIYLESDN